MNNVNYQTKPKILILFGGPSDEHDVSISSAKAISKEIDSDKFDVAYLYITRDLKAKLFNIFQMRYLVLR